VFQGARSSVIMNRGQRPGPFHDRGGFERQSNHDPSRSWVRAERPHSIISRRGAGLAELPAADLASMSRYSKKPGHGAEHGSRLDADA